MLIVYDSFQIVMRYSVHWFSFPYLAGQRWRTLLKEQLFYVNAVAWMDFPAANRA